MTSPTLQFKRGLFVNLPSLLAGEPGFTTDRSDLYVGSSDGNKFYGSSRYWTRENGTNAAEFKFVDKNGNNGISLRSPATVGTSVTYTLPGIGGTAGQFLQLESDGVLAWSSITEGSALNNTTFTGVSTFSGAINATGNASFSGITTVTNVDIQSGKINSTTIGLTTAAAAQFTTLGSNSLNVGGIATVGSLSIGSTQVVSSSFQLQNILSLDATTIATIESSIANAPNTFTDISVSGISTFNGNVILGDNSSDTITVNGTATFNQSITGTISTATRATQVDTTATSADADYYLTFVDTAAGQTGETLRVGSGVSFNPSTNKLSILGDIKVGGNDIQASDGTTAITLSAITGNVGVSSNLTVSGDLYVNGTTTQVNTTSLTIEDTLVELGMVDGSAPGSDLNKDLGLLFNYYDGSAKKASVYWDDSASRIAFASEASESSSVITATAYATILAGGLEINNACTGGTDEVISCVGGSLALSNIVVDGGSF
jgi:hypothetical protein